MTVAFVTFCHPPRYVKRLHEPGVLRGIVDSHQWPFTDVLVVHNQCRVQDYPPFGMTCQSVDLPREEFDPLLLRFGVDPLNARADELTHGPGAPHWWKVHVVNHLRGLESVGSEFTVFADCDTRIVSQPNSWVGVGIAILRNKPDVLIVSPGDGGEAGGFAEGGRWPDGTRLTRNTSQQLFLCRTREFRVSVDFDVPWNGRFDAIGGPLQEWYHMLEGRLARHMEREGQWRAILPDRWRYWHNGKWGTPDEQEGWIR